MIKDMNEHYARKIICWVYEKPYDVYSMKDTYDELFRYKVIVNHDLIGFFCIGKDAQVPSGEYPEGYLDIGVGLKPDLCGKGMGESFMNEMMTSMEGPFRLTVLSWNKRAIKLYEKLGFKEIQRFYRGEQQFIIMTQ